MRLKERSRTLTAFNLYRERLRWANERPEVWESGHSWYRKQSQRLKETAHETGVSLYRLAGVASLLSPLTPWKRNVRGALQLARWNAQNAPEWQLMDVASRATVYNTNARKAVAYLKGNDEHAPGGMKTQPFHRNLAGNLSPVTVDSWMTRIVGNFGLSSPTPTGNAQRAIVRGVKMNATLFNVAPAQVQAIVWITQRDYWNDETASRA
jgi:hypothetical protein